LPGGGTSVKKFVIILGYAFLSLVMLLVAGFAVLAARGRTLDKESKAFVDVAVPAIVSAWDVTELQKHASPEFDDAADYDTIEKLFASLQALGKFQEYGGSKGEANITISLQYGFEITADYLASADFDVGSAEILIALIKHDGRWQILDLKIDTEEYRDRKDII
jgi:hypothetical protein